LPDGTIKHIVIVAHVVSGEAGTLEVVGAVLDVTAAKRTEEHLQASRQRYAQTLWSIGDGVIATDAEQRVAFMNPAAESLTGWSQGEALERPLVDVFVVSQEDGHPTLLGRDGRHLPIEESRSPIFDGVDERGVVVVFRDVTDRRRAEEAEALQHAKEAAEAANKAKDDFLANVSHEIRTPMNAILGMTELMLDATLPGDHRHWLETTKSAADSLLGIIDDLLDFSKIEAGKLELEQMPFSPRDELNDILRALAIRAHGKGLELLGDVSAEVPDELWGDAGRLRQVLVNLVGNAIKFTHTGEVVVRVELRAPVVTDQSVALAFMVRDTGVGIPREKQQLIFEAFAQADNSTTRKYGGTGLGLTIAARLATLMGGEIRVESEPGVGSVFTFLARFVLPAPAGGAEKLAAKHAAQSATVGDNGIPAPSRPSLPSANEQTGPLQVLIAEDNDFNAQLLSQLLQRRGHRVTVAATGEDAAAWAMRGEFDLLLLDLHLPGIDGFEVASRIRGRELGTSQHLPIVAVTARSREEDRMRCLSVGMDAYLTKPIRASTLVETVDRVLGARAAAQAPEGLLDAAVLLDACGGEPELLARIGQALRLHLPDELAHAERALGNHDAPGLREAAHKLHGMTVAVSSSAGAVASRLEDQAERGDLSAAAASLARLTRLSGHVLRALGEVSVGQLQRLLE